MNTTLKKSRTKTAASTRPIPQSKAEAAQQLYLLGIVQRDRIRMKTELDDKIAALTASQQPHLNKLKQQEMELHEGLQIWCEANRVDLLKEGGKTADLVTGEISWRIRPPSVSVRGVDDIIQQLKDNQLWRFLREIYEINKEAILNDPDAVRNIKGLSVTSGVEEFIATPFETKGG